MSNSESAHAVFCRLMDEVEAFFAMGGGSAPAMGEDAERTRRLRTMRIDELNLAMSDSQSVVWADMVQEFVCYLDSFCAIYDSKDYDETCRLLSLLTDWLSHTEVDLKRARLRLIGVKEALRALKGGD